MALVRSAKHNSISVDESVSERLFFVLSFLKVTIGESIKSRLNLARLEARSVSISEACLDPGQTPWWIDLILVLSGMLGDVVLEIIAKLPDGHGVGLLLPQYLLLRSGKNGFRCV